MSPRENAMSLLRLLDSLSPISQLHLIPSSHDGSSPLLTVELLDCNIYNIRLDQPARPPALQYLTMSARHPILFKRVGHRADLFGATQIQHALAFWHHLLDDLDQVVGDERRVRRVGKREGEGRLEQRIEEVQQVNACVQ